MVLGAAEGLHPLAVRGAGLVNVAGDRGGPDEADRLDLRVGQQFVDGGLVALQHVEHPGRQAGLGPQSGQPQRGRRVLLGRLEHDGVARGDGDGEEPHRHHGREVERADDPDRTQRLADRGHVDFGRGVLGHPALEQMGHTAGEFDDLQAAAHFAQRVGDHLAVLGGDGLGQLLLAGIQEFAEVEQDRGALGQRRVAPRGEGGGSGVDHGAGILDRRERNGAGDGAGRRVGHRAGARTGAREWLAVRPVRDRRRCGCCGASCHGGFLEFVGARGCPSANASTLTRPRPRIGPTRCL